MRFYIMMTAEVKTVFFCLWSLNNLEFNVQARRQAVRKNIKKILESGAEGKRKLDLVE